MLFPSTSVIPKINIAIDGAVVPVVKRETQGRKGKNGESGDEEPQEALLAQLPDVERGDRLDLLDLKPEQHFTQAPPRFSEASLVKALEENGIGRPSTYAPILSTLQGRGYVRREAKRLFPTEIGMTVNDLLVEHFPEIVDLGFTAKMVPGGTTQVRLKLK